MMDAARRSGTAWARRSHRASWELLNETRFWIVQALLLAVTVLHGLVEYSESRSTSAFLEGIGSLPVELYILPILMAAFWYGIEGGLMTGLVALTLSVPNMLLWHREDYGWLGEATANVLILAIGVVFGVLAERSVAEKAKVRAKEERLETLHHLSALVDGHDEPRQLVTSALSELLHLSGLEAAVFVPLDEALTDGVVEVGTTISDLRERRLQPQEPGELAQLNTVVRTADVETAESAFGALWALWKATDTDDDDDALLSHVARELATGLERLLMRRREQDQLQRYASAVTEAQETTRRRIARDLHDGAAQSLVILSRGIEWLGGSVGEFDRDSILSDLQEVTMETLDSIRRTIWHLRPPVLDDLGLLPAINSLIERIEDLPTVELDVTGQPRRVDPNLELAAFRIAQEALTNVAKHAGASLAQVEVVFGDNGFRLEVRDNGGGMDSGMSAPGDHFGLLGMRERARTIGGHIDILSNGDKGTRVVFELDEQDRLEHR